MSFRLGHRHAIALTFVVLALVVLIGGAVNSIDARGRVVDDFTDKGIKEAKVAQGTRTAVTDESGGFSLPNVPRTSTLQIDASGYLRTRAPTTIDEIRLQPLSVTIYVYDETKTKDDRLKSPEARAAEDHLKLLSAGNEGGQIIIAPHPGRSAQVWLCAAGFEPKQVTVEGVLMQVGLAPGGSGCPPIPTPTPKPTPAPTPGASPSPSASPSATPAPSPSASPSP